MGGRNWEGVRVWEGGVGEGYGKKNGLVVGEGDEGFSGEV